MVFSSASDAVVEILFAKVPDLPLNTVSLNLDRNLKLT